MSVTATKCRECGAPIPWRGYGRPRELCDICRPEWYPTLIPVDGAKEVPRPVPGPLARHSDPDTSRMAAAQVRRSAGNRRWAILAAFVEHGPLIVAEVQEHVAGLPSTIAGAVSQLAIGGLLEWTGVQRQSSRNTWMREYRITDAGRRETR